MLPKLSKQRGSRNFGSNRLSMWCTLNLPLLRLWRPNVKSAG
jgi:hypothetical protein